MTTIGMVIFPGFELLDLAGPLDVFARAPETRTLAIAASRDLVAPDLAPSVLPDHSFADAPEFDVLFVPGGHGLSAALQDDVLLDFVARRGAAAHEVTSVCTGALILGAAGLLRGKRATTHWRYLDLLALAGAIPTSERVVEDGNVITGAGVTAGIDFGFVLVARMHGDAVAKRLQLGLEYDPAPPFRAGHPSVAAPEDAHEYVRQTQPRYDERRALVESAVKRRSRS